MAPDSLNCYTYSMQGYVTPNTMLSLVLYLSSYTDNVPYNFSDFIPFNGKGAFLEVSEPVDT